MLPRAFKQKTNLELEIGIERRKVAEKKLSEAYKGLQAFAYVASYELKEPLRKIRTYTSLLQNANANIFDAKSMKYSNKVVTAATKMQQLIEDVLKLPSFDDKVIMEQVRIDKVVRNAKDDLELKIL